MFTFMLDFRTQEVHFIFLFIDIPGPGGGSSPVAMTSPSRLGLPRFPESRSYYTESFSMTRLPVHSFTTYVRRPAGGFRLVISFLNPDQNMNA